MLPKVITFYLQQVGKFFYMLETVEIAPSFTMLDLVFGAVVFGFIIKSISYLLGVRKQENESWSLVHSHTDDFGTMGGERVKMTTKNYENKRGKTKQVKSSSSVKKY